MIQDYIILTTINNCIVNSVPNAYLPLYTSYRSTLLQKYQSRCSYVFMIIPCENTSSSVALFTKEDYTSIMVFMPQISMKISFVIQCTPVRVNAVLNRGDSF